MVGTRTAISDNPRLTNRLWEGPQPLRILIDRSLKVPNTHHLLQDGRPALILNTQQEGTTGSLQYVKLEPDAFRPDRILESLYNRGIQSVLLEGGAFLLQSFIKADCWDEARMITNTQLIIPDGIPAPVLSRQQIRATRQLLTDYITFYHSLSTLS